MVQPVKADDIICNFSESQQHCISAHAHGMGGSSISGSTCSSSCHLDTSGCCRVLVAITQDQWEPIPAVADHNHL
jgi:hypothetical protein